MVYPRRSTLLILIAAAFLALTTFTTATHLQIRAATVDLGQACSTDGECLSGRCDRLNEWEDTTCQRQPAGQPCTEDNYCSTTSCLKTQSSDEVGTCKLSNDLGWCAFDADCLSGRCDGDGRCALSAGSSCSASGDCASQRCCNDQCLPALPSSPCQASEECSSGTCDLTTTPSVWKTDRHTYTTGTCTGTAPDGISCLLDSQCTSGVCSTVGFIGSASFSVGLCGAPTDAAFEYMCADQPASVGDTCNGPLECVTGLCSGGGSAPESRRRGAHHRRRDGSLLILSRHFERDGEGEGTCRPASLGGSCIASTDCARGVCDNTKACALVVEGGRCLKAEDCASGNCAAASGLCEPASSSSSTTTTTSSSSSTSTRTRTRSSSSTSTSTTRTRTTTRSTSTRKPTSTSTAHLFPLHHVCSRNDVCASGFCLRKLEKDGKRAEKGVCTAKRELGAKCYANAGCTSGSCSDKSKTCIRNHSTTTTRPHSTSTKHHTTSTSTRKRTSTTTTSKSRTRTSSSTTSSRSRRPSTSSKTSTSTRRTTTTTTTKKPTSTSTTTTTTRKTTTTTTKKPAIPTGTRANGSECTANEQCRTGNCHKPEVGGNYEVRAKKGHCAARLGLGYDCYQNVGCLTNRCDFTCY
ncbi:hypothetical protein V8E36_005225 [Tilletia maclaganii]